MCVYSAIADDFARRWQPQIDQWPTPPVEPSLLPYITRQEFDKLKQELDELREMLKAAKIYDAENGEPDCEMEEKVEVIRKLADLVGVDLSEVLDR